MEIALHFNKKSSYFIDPEPLPQFDYGSLTLQIDLKNINILNKYIIWQPPQTAQKSDASGLYINFGSHSPIYWNFKKMLWHILSTSYLQHNIYVRISGPLHHPIGVLQRSQ